MRTTNAKNLVVVPVEQEPRDGSNECCGCHRTPCRELEDQTDPHDVPASDTDTMVARTPKVHPAIGGLTIAPNGTILISGPLTPSCDSIDYWVLSSAGVPTARFALPSRTEVLLFAGDSMLVHRPTLGEPWEVRWLVLRHSNK